MDTIMILGSLLGMGYFLNKEKQNRNQINERNIVNEHDVPNSYNVYEGNMVNMVRKHEQGLGNSLFQKSKNVKETRVLPPAYNNKGILKKKLSEPSTHHGLKKQVKFSPTLQMEKKPNFNPLAVVANKDAGGFDTIVKNGFSHQNMIPFYSGTGTNQNMGNNNQSIVERFTGSGGLLKTGKKEADNFFQPEKNPNVFTTDAPDDNAKNRYYVSELKTDQLPFDQQRIGPGLDNGYGSQGIDGFHPTYQAPQQTVDDLRVKTNPKQSWGGRTSAVTPLAQERGYQSEVKKNQPERTFNKMNYLLATPTSQTTQQKIPDNFGNIKDTERANEFLGQSGNVGTHNIQKNIIMSKYQNGSKHSQETYDHGSISNQTPKHIVYDETDLPKTTIKQTTLSSYLGNINYNKGKGYLTTKYTAPTTTKETTQSEYIGNVSGNKEPISQQQYYNMEINGLKESTLVNRKPVIVKEQQYYGKEDVNYSINHNTRHEIEDKINQFQNITAIYSQEPVAQRSKVQHKKEVSKNMNDRIDSLFINQMKENPFNHSFS
jgi:hypothetical protein